MNPEMIEKLKKSLTLHEGRKNLPYVDTVGKITIGIGYNLTDRGLDDEWIDNQFLKDINYFYDELNKFEWFDHLNFDRQVVLIDMCFMGLKNFLKFEKMIDAIKAQDYNKAANEMLNSRWAQQVKGRAINLANAMRIGVYTLT